MSGNTARFRWCGRTGGAVGGGSQSRRGNGRQCSRPALEFLEERALLSVDMVTSNADSGPGSLRQMVATAAAGDTIEFAIGNGQSTSTITLTSGPIDINKNLTITNPSKNTSQLVISGNHSSRIFAIETNDTVMLNNLTITDGYESDDYGGALYNRGTLTLNYCTVSNSTAAAGYEGGGLYNINGTVYVNESTFSNDTGGDGGGIYNEGTATLNDSTFNGDSAGSSYNGGGIYNDGTATLTNCTLANNSAEYGGGLYNNGTGTLDNDTVANNTASQGAGAYNGVGVFSDQSDVLYLKSSIFAGNNNSDSSQNYDVDEESAEGGNGIISYGYNLVERENDSIQWQSTDQTSRYDYPNFINPLLAPLGYYGGPTQTFALLPGSPAIGKGFGDSLTTDQRGFAMNNPADVGAFQSLASNSLVVNSTADGSNVPFKDLGLRGAVNLADALETNSSNNPTITFDPTVFATAQTITLTSGQLELGVLGQFPTSGYTSIDGPAAGVTISAGGSSRVFQVDAGSEAKISGLTITGGGGTADKGAGVLNLGTVTMNFCTISGNSGTTNGGGLANYGKAYLNDSTVSGNVATKNGGGFANYGSNATLTDCTISGNRAVDGGGISNATGNQITLLHCTVSANSASGSGGGLYNNGTATLTGTIVASNTNTLTPAGASDIAGTSSVSGTFNLIGTGGSGGLPTGTGTGNIVEVANPGLAALRYYGGPTQTMALIPGSPAIGTGTAGGTSKDQRGFPLDSTVDIGAFQSSNAGSLVVSTTADGSSVAFGKLSLRGAIDLANIASSTTTISFDPTDFSTAQTIVLTSGELEFTNTSAPVTVTTQGLAAGVTVSGGGNSEVFAIVSRVTATLSGLTITGGGGTITGAALGNYGTATLIGCTVSGNSASGAGGGLSNHGTATLINCTITDNVAGQNGGGIGNFGSLTLTNCTISGNSAANAGGLFNNGTAILTDTIIAGNTNTLTSPGASDIAGTTSVSGTYNLIGTGGAGGIVGGASGNIVLTSLSTLGLEPLANYGGPTQTMALSPTSAAIGKGVAANDVTTDQRGMPRAGSAVDVGAFQTSLVVESAAGSVNTALAQLTLPGAVALANEFAGPVVITFDPAVFTGTQTIGFGSGGLELSKPVPTYTIIAPAAGVTIGSPSGSVFQVDQGVTANFQGVTVASNANFPAVTGMQDNGTANVTNCTFSAASAGAAGTGIAVTGGTLNVNNSKVSGWLEGVQLVLNASATINSSTITGNTTAIVVGQGSSDTCTLSTHDVDLSDNHAGVSNLQTGGSVNAMFDWWGQASGPNQVGASTATATVDFSPWLGDAKSLNLAEPDALGLEVSAALSYAVNPDTKNGVLVIFQSGVPYWSVAAKGTIWFVGSGGVTINGESGAGINTNAFTMASTAGQGSTIVYAANDIVQGGTIHLLGNVSPTINAKATANNFDVSTWTGSGTLTAPVASGTVTTVTGTTNAGFTLTNTSLTSPDAMALALNGITTANLTANATTGKPVVIISAAAFTGVTNLTAEGTGAAILFGGGSVGKVSTLTVSNTAAGSNVLIGGRGTNTLVDRGSGRSILIGGGGPNTITGNGRDILISGTTKYDANTAANVAALDAIQAEWSSRKAYATRVKTLRDSAIKGHYGLNSQTVKANGKRNTLKGGSQSVHQNWYLVNFGTDRFTADGAEQATNIPLSKAGRSQQLKTRKISGQSVPGRSSHAALLARRFGPKPGR